MKSFENEYRKQEAEEVSKLYNNCLEEAKANNESGSNCLVGCYGDAAKRFVNAMKKQFPEWHAKAVDLANTAKYTRSSRGSGQYRQNLFYLTFGDTGYYTDPFPKKLKRAELIQEGIFALLRYITADRTKSTAA